MALPPEARPSIAGATPPIADGGLPPTGEKQESLRFRGRRVLVLGGTSGLGKALAEMFVGGGADEVHIGSRTEESAQATIGELRGKTAFGEQQFGTFSANFNNPESVRLQARKMIAEGHIPNVIVMGPAIGVNLIEEPLSAGLTPIRHERSQEGKDKLRDELRVTLREEVNKPENREAAQRVNVEAYEALWEELVPHLEPGTMIINIPSTYSAKKTGRNVFYDLVETFKNEEQENLDGSAPQLAAERGIYVVNIIPHIVLDTQTGRLIRVMIMTLKADRNERNKALSWGVNMKDVTRATNEIVTSNPTEWDSYPMNVYIIGSGDPENPGVQYLEDLPDDHPALTEELL